jgi:hypothetical protein
VHGDDSQREGMFGYVSPEKRVPADHPVQPIRKMVDEILKESTVCEVVLRGGTRAGEQCHG